MLLDNYCDINTLVQLLKEQKRIILLENKEDKEDKEDIEDKLLNHC